jgi:hypothetical protein
LSSSTNAIAINDLGVIVPLFAQPDNSDWYQVASIAKRYPRVKVMAMVRPPLGDVNMLYFGAITMLVTSGVRVFGFVELGTDSSDNERIIKEYKTFYPMMSGVVVVHSPDMPDEARRIAELASTGFETVVLDIPDKVTHTETLHLHKPGNLYSKIGIVEYLSSEEIRDWRKHLSILYTEKQFRWFYFAIAYEDVLSSLFQRIVKELDRIAEQAEGKEMPWGFQMTGYQLTPNTVGLPGGGAENPGGATGSVIPDVAPAARHDFDYFGIKKLYPDVRRDKSKKLKMYASKEPQIAEKLKGGNGLSQVFKEDGIENIEFTFYARRIDKKSGKNFEPETPLYTVYVNESDKTGYEIIVSHGGFSTINKIVEGKQGVNRAANGTRNSLREWIGFKIVYYQFAFDIDSKGKDITHARIQLWMDENCSDQQGNLVIAGQNWRLVQETTDDGRWTFEIEKPKKLDKHIIPITSLEKVIHGKMQGCTLVTHKEITTEIKYMSIREIQPQKPD